MAAVGTVDANQMLQGGHAFADFLDPLAEAAVIEKPGGLGVVQKFYICVGGVAEVYRNPRCPSAQNTQHAEQYRRMILRKDRRTLLASGAAGQHSLSDAFAESAGFTVRIKSVPLRDRSAVRMKFRALVEIIDRSYSSVRLRGARRLAWFSRTAVQVAAHLQLRP